MFIDLRIQSTNLLNSNYEPIFILGPIQYYKFRKILAGEQYDHTLKFIGDNKTNLKRYISIIFFYERSAGNFNRPQNALQFNWSVFCSFPRDVLIIICPKLWNKWQSHFKCSNSITFLLLMTAFTSYSYLLFAIYFRIQNSFFGSVGPYQGFYHFSGYSSGRG